MYNGWLDSALSSGKTATGNYERLKDPAVDQMLAKLAGAETTAQQTAALEPIAKYVAANLPIIPTTTASQWFQYNSQNYVGWPTPDNPTRPVGPPNQQRSRLWRGRSGHLSPPPAAVRRQQEPPGPLKLTLEGGGSLERTRAMPGTKRRRKVGDDPLRSGQQCAHLPALLDPRCGDGGALRGRRGRGAYPPHAVSDRR
jgi:hypothetical protein